MATKKAAAKTVLEQITALQEAAKKLVPRGDVTSTLVPGRKYFVWGPRNNYIGRLVAVTGPYTVSLAEACWVADCGRLHALMLTGKGDGRLEVEPVGNAPVVQVQDVFDWPHDLFGEAV